MTEQLDAEEFAVKALGLIGAYPVSASNGETGSSSR